MAYREQNRALVLLKILLLESSARHPLTTEELLGRMAEEGAPCERKAIYRTIAQMNACEICIRYRRGKGGGYWFAGGWIDGTDPEKEE